VWRPGRVLPPGKDPQYPLYRRLGGPQSRPGHRGWRKSPFASAGGSILDRPVVQPVARHYTDWTGFIFVVKLWHYLMLHICERQRKL
jgi:hypothetical protein